MSKRDRYALYATVFLTGAAVLVIEVGAVRLLSPHFGSSLYVLSSVLTTVLAALSFGYYVGGRLSDRIPTPVPLYRMITLSGFLTLLLLYGALSMLPAAGAILSPLYGPLLLSLLFFFVPAFLLGTVSPYIIKLHSLSVDEAHLGTVVGSTFFWGTVGSIVGSLLSGFYLIPFIGVSQSIGLTGVVLVCIGVAGELLLPEDVVSIKLSGILGSKRLLFGIGMIGIAFFILKFIDSHVSPHPHTVLYEDEGLYSHILVYETRHLGQQMRGLKRDTNNSSASFVNSDTLVFGYTQFAPLYGVLVPGAERFLLIGGGAYSIPRTLTSMDEKLIIDVAEIEPNLFDLAQKYFGLTDVSRINNYAIDGRLFLARSTTTYDIIFGDAFGTDLGVPHHLASQEFFEEVKEHLAPGGIFMMNAIGKLYQEPVSITGSLIKTMQSIFPNMKVYAFNKSHPDSMQNLILVARNGDAPIDFSGERISDTNGKTLSVPSLEVDLTRFPLAEELIFTDNRAPIEYLMARQQRAPKNR